MHVVLVEPEIPPNTGNIARTCAATGLTLHLIEPLGFSLEDRYMKRAGIDYWHLVDVHVHPSWEALPEELRAPENLHLFTSHGGTVYSEVSYGADAVLVFGKESVGLPASLTTVHPQCLRQIPMASGVRSLNVGNAVAIVVYEAMRQRDFRGLGRA